MGSEVARRGIGLGFEKVIAYDPYASEVKAAALGVKLVSWEEALAQADFFSLHMPQTPQTKVRRAPPAFSIMHIRYLHGFSRAVAASHVHDERIHDHCSETIRALSSYRQIQQ